MSSNAMITTTITIPVIVRCTEPSPQAPSGVAKKLFINPPCFPKENATAIAGAEDFPPCFPDLILVSKGGFQFLTVKLHKVGSILFRCPKIRKTKYA